MTTKTTYKGREYSLLWEGQTKYGRRAKLALPGGKEFWVDADLIGKAAPAKKAAAPKRRAAKTLAADEREIVRESNGSGDRGYHTGWTYHLPRVSGGGGADGRYWTVTAAGKRHGGDLDAGSEGQWMCWAHVRPATEAEIADM